MCDSACGHICSSEGHFSDRSHRWDGVAVVCGGEPWYGFCHKDRWNVFAGGTGANDVCSPVQEKNYYYTVTNILRVFSHKKFKLCRPTHKKHDPDVDVFKMSPPMVYYPKMMTLYLTYVLCLFSGLWNNDDELDIWCPFKDIRHMDDAGSRDLVQRDWCLFCSPHQLDVLQDWGKLLEKVELYTEIKFCVCVKERKVFSKLGLISYYASSPSSDLNTWLTVRFVFDMLCRFQVGKFLNSENRCLHWWRAFWLSSLADSLRFPPTTTEISRFQCELNENSVCWPAVTLTRNRVLGCKLQFTVSFQWFLKGLWTGQKREFRSSLVFSFYKGILHCEHVKTM